MPLRKAAVQSNREIFIGAELGYNELKTDEEWAKVGAEQYDLTTCGNCCKWQATEPQRNEFDFSECDYVYRFAVDHNMTFRGRNLCWGSYNPSWLEDGDYAAQELQSILKNHIVSVIQHYDEEPGVYGWDVVNEAVSDSPGLYPDIYKENVWYPSLKDYVVDAFKFADTARKEKGIRTKLFYNDYSIHYEDNKSNAVYQMIQHMQAQNVSIDGLGVQCHFGVSSYPLSFDKLVANLKRFSDLGLEIHVTEMDVECGTEDDPCEYSPQYAQQQAQMYQTVLRACMATPRCKSFESWGYTDKYSWRGSQTYPLPFDKDLKPKAAASYIENTLLNATSIK